MHHEQGVETSATRRSAALEAFKNVIRTLLPRLLVVAELAVVTRALDPSTFGSVMALVFTSSLLNPLAGGSHWTSATRLHSSGREEALTSQLFPQLLISNAFVALVVVGVGTIGLDLTLVQVLPYAVLMAVANTASRAWFAIATSNVGRLLGAQLAGAVVRLALLLAIGVSLTAGEYLAVIGGTTALFSALTWMVLPGPTRVAGPVWTFHRRLVADTWRILQLDLMVAVYSFSDTIMLAALYHSGDAGDYAAAYRIFLVFVSIRGAVLEVALPSIARVEWSTMVGALRRISWPIVPAAVFVVAVGWLLSPWVVDTLLGESFSGATVFLRCLCVVAGLMTLNVGYSIALVAHTRDRTSRWIRATAMFGNVGLNAAFIPRFGGLGAAGATMASEASVTVLSAFSIERRLGSAASFGVVAVFATAYGMWSLVGL